MLILVVPPVSNQALSKASDSILGSWIALSSWIDEASRDRTYKPNNSRWVLFDWHSSFKWVWSQPVGRVSESSSIESTRSPMFPLFRFPNFKAFFKRQSSLVIVAIDLIFRLLFPTRPFRIRCHRESSCSAKHDRDSFHESQEFPINVPAWLMPPREPFHILLLEDRSAIEHTRNWIRKHRLTWFQSSSTCYPEKSVYIEIVKLEATT